MVTAKYHLASICTVDFSSEQKLVLVIEYGMYIRQSHAAASETPRRVPQSVKVWSADSPKASLDSRAHKHHVVSQIVSLPALCVITGVVEKQVFVERSRE